MNVLIDFQILCMQRWGGISRYMYCIAKGMKKRGNVKLYVPVLFSQNYYFQDIVEGKTVNAYWPKTRKIIKYLNAVYTILKMRKETIDIYHPTYYFPYLIKLCKKKKINIVVTIHDMIHELYPPIMLGSDYTIKCKRKFIYAADTIIAVSENTKKDILKFYPDIDQNRIQVIYEGGTYEKDIQMVKKLPSKYILFVGKRRSYKNFDLFLEAISKLLREEADLDLICIGGGEFTENEKEKLMQMNILENVHQIDCTDAQLNYIYRHALCMVYPSLYEGFGIPILEAFENGCPVVCSRSSCFPEIAQDAARFFDPDCIEDIYQKVKEMIIDIEMRKQYIERGRLRSQMFSWENMEDEIYIIYEKLMEEKK